jgi:hypothetical protein
MQRLTENARAYLMAKRDSQKASDARAALPVGSSRSKVTSANARWMAAAEERDRIAALLTPDERESVGMLR